MMLAADLTDLKEQHRALEAQIDAEMRRPTCDDMKISQLKREKLQVKDEIARLEDNHAA